MQGSPTLLHFGQLQRTAFFRNLFEAFYCTFARWADFYSLRLTICRFKCPSQPLIIKFSPCRKSPLAVKVHPLSWSQRQFDSVQWAYGDLTTSSDKLLSRLYGCAITLRSHTTQTWREINF
jgi:hypothetical protein